VSVSVGGATVDPTKIRVALINPAFAVSFEGATSSYYSSVNILHFVSCVELRPRQLALIGGNRSERSTQIRGPSLSMRKHGLECTV
jgi:hypothetical protein